MNYIVAPMEITAREFEIYRLLYKRMDFKTFITKYTLDQLVYDSDKIFDFNKTKVNTIIKKFIKEGYITVIEKGVKGKPTIYEITKMSKQISNEYKQISNEFQTNNKQINVENTGFEGDEKTNNKQIINESSTNINKNLTPIKDKDKEKEYIDQIWKMYPKKTGKKKSYDKIPKILKDIGFDKLKECICNYKKYIDSTKRGDYIQSYMGGDRFFSGMYLDYLEETEIDIKPNLKENKQEVRYNPDSEFKINSIEEAMDFFKNKKENNYES